MRPQDLPADGIQSRQLTKSVRRENAIARKERILSEPSAARFDPMLDAELRKAFSIHLPA